MSERLEVLVDRSLDPLTDSAAESRVLAGAPGLGDFYGGPLTIPVRPDRPTVVANFVSTLDGVVSYNEEGAWGGGAISGRFPSDRRLMGALRTMADAVLVGAGTVRHSNGGWTPRSVDPEMADQQRAARRALKLAPQPTTAVVTASGDLDLDHPGLSAPDAPVVLFTTATGAKRLPLNAASERVQVVAVDGEEVPASRIVAELGARNQRLVVCEGGPHLFGSLLGAGLIDELFLTIAPQVAGRAPDRRRLALVEGAAFGVKAAPWSSLVSARQAGDFLFLRYRFQSSTQGEHEHYGNA